MKKYEFDVAFSYASEQHKYVERATETLKKEGVRVFDYVNEASRLWGKDLYQYLSDVYQNKAKYCVLFLSQDYANKFWTRYELKSAQARAFQESREYILPARFDNTEIPGLLPTIAYMDLKNYSPEEFASLVKEKVGSGAPIEDSQNKSLRKIETLLADAVIQAEDYLLPQPLIISDDIAEVVRSSFEIVNSRPNEELMSPYLRSEKPSYRVVGYIAFQTYPVEDLIPELITCLYREKRLAKETKETRPLWQLLVCFTRLHKLNLGDKQERTIKKALGLMYKYLQEDGSVDVGGQCKRRIEYLLRI